MDSKKRSTCATLKPCSYRLSAPSSSANLGPGFDCLGIALNQRNVWEVRLVESSDAGSCRLVESTGGDGLEAIPTDETHLFFSSWRRLHDTGFGPDLFEMLKESGLAVEMKAQNATPISRGLGSSAALRVASAAVYARLTGCNERPAWELASQLEGHPDNAGAAGLGGLVVGTLEEETNRYRLMSPPIHECWKVAVAVPRFCVKTDGARQALPKILSYPDAVFNMGRVPFLLEGLKTGDAELVRLGCQDRWHQNQRASLVPGLISVMKAATDAGAAAAFLSGAGPTVGAFVDSRKGEEFGRGVALSMGRAYEKSGVGAEVQVLSVDTRGLEVCNL